MPSDITLVYADESLVVVNKPAGLLAVPGRGADKADCVSLRVQRKYPDALIVHRLDQATSGLMLLARGLVIQRALSLLFETRQVHKQYVAVVHGLLEQDTGSINLPLAADWPARPRQKVDHQLGKAALTHYCVLSRDTSACTTRLVLEPITGRTHQLRVHLSALGHPILGDALYSGTPSLELQAPPLSTRLLLHAQQLSLIHPASALPMVWQVGAVF
jgi:tRNA pseudouridine32 synthase / 23S rRNA pseudouridine746 synthase